MQERGHAIPFEDASTKPARVYTPGIEVQAGAEEENKAMLEALRAEFNKRATFGLPKGKVRPNYSGLRGGRQSSEQNPAVPSYAAQKKAVSRDGMGLRQ